MNWQGFFLCISSNFVIWLYLSMIHTYLLKVEVHENKAATLRRLLFHCVDGSNWTKCSKYCMAIYILLPEVDRKCFSSTLAAKVLKVFVLHYGTLMPNGCKQFLAAWKLKFDLVFGNMCKIQEIWKFCLFNHTIYNLLIVLEHERTFVEI